MLSRIHRSAKYSVVAAPLLPALLMLACTDSGSDQGSVPDVIRTDSAGVEIVETRRAAWGESEGWTVASEPDLEIGLLDGEEPFLFTQISGVVRFDDGTIVVGDSQTREIRYFDSTGRFLWAVGGPGGGPTEFRRGLYKTWRCGPDLVYAYDIYADLVLVWDREGQFLRRIKVVEPVPPARGPYRLCCTSSGGFVAVSWGDLSKVPTLEPGEDAMMYTQMADVWGFGADGKLEVEYGPWLSSERIRTRGGSTPHPFSRSVSFAEGGGVLYIGTGETFEILAYEGPLLQRVLRGPSTGLVVPEGLLEAYQEADLDEDGEDDRRRVMLADGAMPPQLPAYTDMLVSPSGHLWVKRFALPWETGAPERWGVFRPDGVFLGDIELPPRFRLTYVDDEAVVGVTWDDLDVERVRVYRILR